MAGTKPTSRDELKRLFAEDARVYCKYLRLHHPEHFMESTPQATQRKITLAAFDIIRERCPDIQCFNELLIQYYRKGESEIQRVVPDNFIVVHPVPIDATGSFAVPEQPVGPYWTLEYVSKENERKDDVDSFNKYERDLRVPYYLMFYPDNDELTLYRLNTRKRYSTVKPNEAERYPVPELELEVALIGKWVRFWFRGELLPLTGEMVRQIDTQRERLDKQREQLDKQCVQLDTQREQLDKERLRAEKLAALLREAGIDPDA